MQKLIGRLGVLMFCVTMFCMLLTLCCNIVGGGLGIQAISSSIEFPLGSKELLSVDKEGHICYHSKHYMRLEIYDRNGDFVRGWFVPSGYTARIDPSGDFIRAIDVWDDNIIYDFSGKILKKYNEKGSSDILTTWSRETPKDGEGNTYILAKREWRTKIARVDPNGNLTVVVREPNHLCLIRIPFPVFAYMYASAILLFLSEVVLKKRKTKESGNDIPDLSTNEDM